jgi:hypothetical protein
VFHIGYFRHIITILQCICKVCIIYFFIRLALISFYGRPVPV